ncbi:MAG: DUF4347 domain-containing protein [Pseudomonadota bacterium]
MSSAMGKGRIIYVIDDRVDWEAGLRGAFWGPFIAAHTRGEATMSCATSMVDNVLAMLAPDDRIAGLRIVDHATETGIELGDDWVTLRSFSTHAPVLSRLTSRFGTGGFAHFVGCLSGNNPALLSRFARLWGVPVTGGTGTTNGLGLNHGAWISVCPQGRVREDAGWPHPAAADTR